MQPNTPNDTFDPNLVNAINGGNAPDVAMPFGPDYIGQYCSSGLWQDLTPYMKADGLSIDDFAPGAITYTNSGGKQCALPSLTDAFGLYYNTRCSSKAGIAGPPKTMDELMADAKKLTVRNPDGTHQGGRVRPAQPVGGARARRSRQTPGAPSGSTSSGKAVSSRTDPGWASAFTLAEAADRLVRLRQHHQVLRRQHEQRVQYQQRVPERQGGDDVRRRVAHGVHQARQAPNLQYGTAPFPADAAHPESTAPSRVGGTIVGIPKGAKHPDQAWLLVKYLASDTNYLVQMANASATCPRPRLRSASPALTLPPQFDTFLQAWVNPKSAFAPPLHAVGRRIRQPCWTRSKTHGSPARSVTASWSRSWRRWISRSTNQLAQGTAP